VYPEFFVSPMREELTRLGVVEWRTSEDVDRGVQADGTVMVIVNSVCGCAAGRARPGISLALKHSLKPDLVATVFAGADVEATERARSYFTGYPPSSPAVALLQNGKIIHMLERHQIENQEAEGIALDLTAAFDKHCTEKAANV
jgi:putative YphP/YqiW family bacilliredoxin